MADEYDVDDEFGGETVPREETTRDPLLDLGERKEVSVLCVREATEVSSEEIVRKIKEEEFLEKCMKWSRDDRQWEDDVEAMDMD